MLEDVFGLSEYQDKATYGFGYKLTLTRNKDFAVFQKAVALGDARIKINHIIWYVRLYISYIQQRGKLNEQILSSKTPTELTYNERSVFMKEVNNQNLRNFELCSQENMNVLLWIIIGFQQRNRQDSQSFFNDSFVDY